MLQLLQNQHAGSLGHHQAIAILVKGPTGLGWLGMLRKYAQLCPAGQHTATDGRVRAASQDDSVFAVANAAKRLADGHRARRARRRHGVVTAAQFELDRKVARQGIEHVTGN